MKQKKSRILEDLGNICVVILMVVLVVTMGFFIKDGLDRMWNEVDDCQDVMKTVCESHNLTYVLYKGCRNDIGEAFHFDVICD